VEHLRAWQVGALLEAEYGKHYGELYRLHWWWRAREEALLNVLWRQLRSNRGLEILDVGCGNGLFFDKLAEFGNVEGIEPDAELVDPMGRHSSKIHLVPFDKNFHPQKRFDLILMLDVLEHLDHPEQALMYAHELLKEGAALLISVPAFQSLWTSHDVMNQHRIRFRRRTLFPLLQEAGFEIAESKYWYQWVFPVKLAAGVAERIVRPRPSPPRIPPKWLNSFLYRISRVEQETLGMCGIPFGSSLMAFCRRDKLAPPVIKD
jgi:2-polyprenyl-3-methyl-5-hydroxy-6-metoxy-1,4-benzoquinol methylase